jgi:hypothetical protein
MNAAFAKRPAIRRHATKYLRGLPGADQGE